VGTGSEWRMVVAAEWLMHWLQVELAVWV